MKTPTIMQKKALEDNVKVLTAGAGSGKTLVLTHRYDKYIQDGMKIPEIVAFTFTNKAANEMKARVVEFVLDRMDLAKDDDEYKKWWDRESALRDSRISTIHSFCGSLLREYPLQAGLSPAFKILEENEAKWVINDIISEIWLEIMTLEGDLEDENGMVLERDDLMNVLERVPKVDELMVKLVGKREMLSIELLKMYETNPDALANEIGEMNESLETET